jgi:streptogramin lyase
MKAIAGIEDQRRGMLLPQGVAVDSRGRLLVADTKARLIHVFDPSRRRYRQLRSPTSNPMAAPIGVATDKQDRIYVTDAVSSSFPPRASFFARWAMSGGSKVFLSGRPA